MPIRMLVAAAGATCLAASLPARAGNVFITELGALFPTGLTTVAYDVSNDGTIVGASQDPDGFGRPFVWRQGVMSELGGSRRGAATGVNTDGDIVGYVTDPIHAVRFAGESFTELGTLPGGGESQAFAINGSGLVVGNARNAAGQNRAAIFQNGVAMSLGVLPGGDYSGAVDVNSFGQIVGTSSIGNARIRAFVYQNGVMTPIDTFGGSESIGEGINSLGVIVGSATLPNNQQRGFVLEDGEMTAIGTFGGDQSQALDINNYNQVVGWARDAAGNPRALLYEEGVMTDLNSLLPPESGWTRLEVAHAISDARWIVGEGIYGNRERAFLMIIPAPATPCPFALLLIAATRRCRHPCSSRAG